MSYLRKLWEGLVALYIAGVGLLFVATVFMFLTTSDTNPVHRGDADGCYNDNFRMENTCDWKPYTGTPQPEWKRERLKLSGQIGNAFFLSLLIPAVIIWICQGIGWTYEQLKSLLHKARIYPDTEEEARIRKRHGYWEAEQAKRKRLEAEHPDPDL